MNNEQIDNDKEEVLKIVNEDWPMLEELGKKRFVINKKKGKDIQESLSVLQTVLEEDNNLSENHERYFSEMPMVDMHKSEAIILPKSKDDKIILDKEILTVPPSQIQHAAPVTSQSEIMEKINKLIVPISLEKESVKQVVPKIQNLQQSEKENIVEEKSMDIFKFIISGLTFLYISKIANLLKPIKFVMEHYKEITMALLYCVIPLFMTYLITTQVSFVNEQLIKETNLMKAIYISVFFCGATFVWITSQVILAGFYSMVRKSILEVVKVGKQNKEK